MRVIAGEFRSRRLKSIPGAATRPTPDRLRETLFDILGRASQARRSWTRTREPARSASKRSAAAPRTRSFWSAIAGRWRRSGRIWRRWAGARATVVAGRCCDPRSAQADTPISFSSILPEAFGSLSRTRMVKQGDNALSFYSADLRA
jgi:hypothetical protein